MCTEDIDRGFLQPSSEILPSPFVSQDAKAYFMASISLPPMCLSALERGLFEPSIEFSLASNVKYICSSSWHLITLAVSSACESASIVSAVMAESDVRESGKWSGAVRARHHSVVSKNHVTKKVRGLALFRYLIDLLRANRKRLFTPTRASSGWRACSPHRVDPRRSARHRGVMCALNVDHGASNPPARPIGPMVEISTSRVCLSWTFTRSSRSSPARPTAR